MCLAAFALDAHPRFPLVIAANRDEFFARAAAPMAWWQAGGTELLAGRDLSAGGTWFGLTRAGRLALLTNVREPARNNPAAPTRGTLVVDWLAGTEDAATFADRLPQGYNGFNLITADVGRGDWHWISNRSPRLLALPGGIHALSNAALDTPWPKTTGLQAAMADALARAGTAAELADLLFAALADPNPAPDDALPDTGVGLARERLLSPRFVRLPDPARPGIATYGTRCATVLVREASGATQVIERSVTAEGNWLTPIHHELTRWP
ncbi:MAG TPA: NRDE family protein [Roseateles sp.]